MSGSSSSSSSRKYISISVPDKPDSMSPHIKSAEELRVIGFNLSDFSRTVQFLICVAGVFTFYLIYGYLQELIFSVEGFKPFGWYLTLVQFAFYSTFGLIELQLTQDKRRSSLKRNYMYITCNIDSNWHCTSEHRFERFCRVSCIKKLDVIQDKAALLIGTPSTTDAQCQQCVPYTRCTAATHQGSFDSTFQTVTCTT